jgi:hypothetical protein
LVPQNQRWKVHLQDLFRGLREASRKQPFHVRLPRAIGDWDRFVLVIFRAMANSPTTLITSPGHLCWLFVLLGDHAVKIAVQVCEKLPL